jgi:outer membrane protein assembly factor BamB
MAKILWKSTAGCVRAPTVTKDLVLAMSSNGVLTALDRKTGKTRWKSNVAGTSKMWGGVAADGTTAYICGDDRLAHAVDLATGKTRWSEPMGWYLWGAPAVAGELVLLPTGNGRLIAAAAADGARRWVATLGGSYPATPTVAGELAYVTCGKTIHALNLKNGRRAWKLALDTKHIRTPVALDGDGATMYVGSLEAGGKGFAWALDLKTRNRHWKHAFAKQITGALTAEDGVVFAAGDGPPLEALDAKKGSKKWAFKDFSTGISHTIASRDGLVVFGHRTANKLVGVKGGKTTWSVALPFEPDSPAIADDGTVYVGGEKGVAAVK